MTPAGRFLMIAKTFEGLEGVLSEELKSLGCEEVKLLNRAVSFMGDRSKMMQVNLWSRCALRILIPLTDFTAWNADDLYKFTREIDWSAYLDARDSFAVDCVAVGDVHIDSTFAGLRVKDAIADQFREKVGYKRPNVDRKAATLRIHLQITDAGCTLAIDSSGDSLHLRGYRLEKNAAPLNEVLAAGLIKLTGWKGDTAFVDPMCGSGTLLIEAAWMAMNMAPGLRRSHFGFQRWKDFDALEWQRMITLARRQAQPLKAPILGGDIDRKSLETHTRNNLVRAGLSGKVEARFSDLRHLNPPPAPGVLICNAPFGETVLPEEIDELFTVFGETLKQKYSGYDAWIFTTYRNALRHIALRADRQLILFNGPMECTFRHYPLHHGHMKSPPNASSDLKSDVF